MEIVKYGSCVIINLSFAICFGVGFSAISYLYAIPFGGVGFNVITFCINFCNPFWSTFLSNKLLGLRVLHTFSCPIHQLFLYFLTLSLEWISFIHTFKRKLKNRMGLLQVNTKNLCTFFIFGEWVGKE
jgi:hypothetical protein